MPLFIRTNDFRNCGERLNNPDLAVRPTNRDKNRLRCERFRNGFRLYLSMTVRHDARYFCTPLFECHDGAQNRWMFECGHYYMCTLWSLDAPEYGNVVSFGATARKDEFTRAAL